MVFGLFNRKKALTCCHEMECPNAWGHQKFNGEFFRRKKDKQIDVNNKLVRYGFIKDFQVNYVDGIRLKGQETLNLCKSCNHG